MIYKLAAVGLLNAPFNASNEAGLIFEHPGNSAAADLDFSWSDPAAAPELMPTHLNMPSRPLIILRTVWDNATLAGAARVPAAALSSPSSCSQGLARKA